MTFREITKMTKEQLIALSGTLPAKEEHKILLELILKNGLVSMYLGDDKSLTPINFGIRRKQGGKEYVTVIFGFNPQTIGFVLEIYESNGTVVLNKSFTQNDYKPIIDFFKTHTICYDDIGQRLSNVIAEYSKKKH